MNDDFGARLGAALREQAPENRTHLTLDDVAPRARGIRRRRGGAAVGGLAAVLAATIFGAPVAITALGGDDPAPVPTPAGPAPGPEWTLPPEVQLADDAPLQPGLEGVWLVGGVELSKEIPVPPGAQDSMTKVGERWLIGYQDDGDRKLYSIELGGDPSDALASSGTLTDAVAQAKTFDLHDRVAVSDGADLAAFSTPSGVLTLIDASGRTRVVATLPSPGTPIDLVGDARCMDGTGCEVVVSYGDGRAPETVRGDGTRTVIDEDAVAVDAATNDLVATRTEGGVSAACTSVLERTEQDASWESCEIAVTGFSPDGSLAVVKDSYQSGSGPTRLGVADARTGKVLTWFTPAAEEGFVRELAWTPQGELEITSYTNGDQSWRLHHVSSSGSVTQRVAASTGEDASPPQIAVTRP